MHEEWFDVVDGDDRVVGRETRREVHRRGLLHRAIHILVFGRDGRVFLQKRSLKKDSAPGAWAASCSGHVDSGEDYDEAARRELREELGVEAAAPLERLFKLGPSAATGNEFVWIYRTAHDGPFTLAPEEIERGAWYGRDEVDTGLRDGPGAYAESFRLVWAEAGRRGFIPD